MSLRLLVAGLLLIGALPGHGATEVDITAIDPAEVVALGPGDALSVRLSYSSDRALRFQVEAWDRGRPVTGAHTNPAPAYPAGRGEAIAWVAPQNAGRVDEIRVQVMDEQWQPVRTVSKAVSVHWRPGIRRAAGSVPSWVATLNEVQQANVRAASAATGSGGGFGTVLVMLMGLSIPGYLILQVYALTRYPDGWRRAAMVPLILMVPLVAYTVFALLAGSNLWPLMLLFLAPLAFLYLAGLAVMRARRA